ncbi:hypothetical protein ABTZ03_34485 [Kitasatospora sp. NPDC096077]|uniref:hypothetical protein n=1 Tax=Kitasatospora sp. NPDC096077 TaxID=3155544 RepID=UPI00331EA437
MSTTAASRCRGAAPRDLAPEVVRGEVVLGVAVLGVMPFISGSARFVRRDLAVPKSRTHALGYRRP